MDVQTLSRRQSGVTLIESLIAMAVLSIGLLGIAAMFLSSLRDAGSGLWRTRAVAFSEDIVERMRANRTALATYSAGIGQSNGCAATNTMLPGTLPATCSPAQLAEQDVLDWQTRLSNNAVGLPNGTGSIDIGAGTPASVTITVRWTEGVAADGSPLIQQVVLGTQL